MTNTKRYRITFEIEVKADSSHPRKWVPDAVCEALEAGEDALSWEFEELVDTPAE